MKKLKFYLNLIGDIKGQLVYITNNFEKIKSTKISEDLKKEDLNIYVDTVSTLYKYYKDSEDNLCRLFNAINWGYKVRNIPEDVKEIYNMYKNYRKSVIREFDCNDIDNFCFSEDGYKLFFTLLMKSENHHSVFKDNTCNHQNILDTEMLYIHHLKINDNSYSLVAIHAGGDLRGNYYRYLMVKNLSCYDTFELGTEVFEIPLIFVPNKKIILNKYCDLTEGQGEFFSKKSRKDSIKSFLDINYPIKKFSVNGEGYITDDDSGNQDYMFEVIDDKFFSEEYTLCIGVDNIYFYE